MLTRMSLIDQLRERGVFKPWEIEGPALPQRGFWYTGLWKDSYNQLARGTRSGTIARDSSEKGRVAGLINDYVLGVPLVRLITPVGYGSDPVAKRLDPPRNGVVYFRTGRSERPKSAGVRCFGFFRSPNNFYAVSLMRKQPRCGNVDPIDDSVKPLTNLFDRI